jgi:hypothetical protein
MDSLIRSIKYRLIAMRCRSNDFWNDHNKKSIETGLHYEKYIKCCSCVFQSFGFENNSLQDATLQVVSIWVVTKSN